jgi:peptidyl-tRNA hydrolase, PTH1 family
MKLIFGLGNPGTSYQSTRHNVGYLAVEELARVNLFPQFKLEAKFKAEISTANINGEKVILAKPTTFMNLSGESVSLLKSFYKLSVDDLLFIYDDKDMEFGKIRTRSTGSSGGHNGVKDLIRVLGPDFVRIKIGVGNNTHPAYKNASDFVLGKFSLEELTELSLTVLPEVCRLVVGF